jgi:hypothetical protein
MQVYFTYLRRKEPKTIWISPRPSCLVVGVHTSKLVKSGDKNLSFSKSLDHGSSGIIFGAPSTKPENAFVRSRFTVAHHPSLLSSAYVSDIFWATAHHSPLIPFSRSVRKSNTQFERGHT